MKKDKNIFDALGKKVTEELNKAYIPDTLKYIEKHNPGLNEKINQAEARLNEVWLREVSLEAFREALREWYLLNMEAIRFCKGY
ncbi:hypothetical protein KKC52_13500 [bacterium]|nr:hypothetical protein [bacterium]